MTNMSYSAGDLIISKGEISQAVYTIIRGKVRIEVGEETFFLSDGDIFGEEGLFFDKPSPYNASSTEDTLIRILNEEEAKKHIFQNPDVSFSVFIKNFGQLWRDFKPFTPLSPRYVRIIEELIPFAGKTESDTPDLPTEITVSDLAAKVQTDVENLIANIKRASVFGHIQLKGDDKILTVGKRKLLEVVYEYYRESFFSHSETDIGTGSYTLGNLLKVENKAIFNSNSNE